MGCIKWYNHKTTEGGKDIGTIYAQAGWYVVPNYVTAIEVEAVYGRVIYARSPFDKMYYNEYHAYAFRENILPDNSVVASSTALDNRKTETVVIPEHTQSLNYVLHHVSINEEL